MSSDNYPLGAASDPRAPYNEPRPVETDVTVRVVMVKQTSLTGCGCYVEREYEYDATLGCHVCTAHPEPAQSLREAFDEQQRSPRQIIEACAALCRQLQREGHVRYAGVNLSDLCMDCEGWDDEETEIKSKKVKNYDTSE